jgi:hypothetical protein
VVFFSNPSFENDPNRPYTHALVIGVNSYQFLPSNPGAQTGPDGNPITGLDLGLGQLTTPSISARALAAWIAGNFYNEQAPLGSLHLLVSEDNPASFQFSQSQGAVPERARCEKVETAFKEWRSRCQRNPQNIALFYFCGHGVLVNGDQVLLLEDYGADDWEPFKNTINIGQLQQGMEHCRAGLQCYFIDACSNFSYQAANLRNSVGQSWSNSAWPQTQDQLPVTLVLKAAVEGKLSGGITGRVSRFTNALIQCLDGRGCYQEGGKWVVSTTSLIDSVYRVVEELNTLEGGPALIPKATPVARSPIHYRQDPPLIPAVIQVEPARAMQYARLRLDTIKQSNWFRECIPGGQPWKLDDIRAGSYFIRANFNPQEYQDLEEVLMLTPPGPYSSPFPAKEAK